MQWHDFINTVVTIAIVMGVLQGACAYLILVERKIAAYMQDRIGPNRVGPRGLLQPIADGLKFLFKEEVIPDRADKVLFLAAPAIAIITATLAFAVVPFGPTPVAGGSGHDFIIAPHVDIGILFIFAVTSLTVYAIILGGWSSNNKFSLVGGLRSSAQLVSYEIPMGMSVLGVVLLTGSLNLEEIIARQSQGMGWFIWYQPLGFMIFLISAFAECNRLPFDLPEAEQELVGGYHTEYSALKFGMFFLGEYTHMITTSFLMVILFFGGWHLPWLATATSESVIAKFIVFFVKVSLFILFYMLVRWTIPRFRFDQLMGLAWKCLIPLALGNLVVVMIVREWAPDAAWILLPVISIVLIAVAVMIAVKWPPAPRAIRTGFTRPNMRADAARAL